MRAPLTSARASAALKDGALNAPPEGTMIYQVKRARRDKNGNILALCGDGWTKSKADVSREIISGMNHFYVEEAVGKPRVYVKIFPLAGIDHLTTDADGNSDNNLDNLDPC